MMLCVLARRFSLLLLAELLLDRVLLALLLLLLPLGVAWLRAEGRSSIKSDVST